MGMSIAQTAQPISQQQPAPQGKGAAAMAPGTYDPNASMNGIRSQLEPTQNAAVAQPDSTTGGVPNQAGDGQTPIGVLGSAMSGIGGSGKGGGFNNVMQGAGHGFQQQGQAKGGGQAPQPQTSQGKSGGQPNEFISQAPTTNSATSGQPQMGQPNTYSNTVGPWDNSNNQPQTQSGKGKGH